MRASSSSFSSLTRWPLSQYLPLDGVSRQPIRFISVDLPEPDGPMMATYSLWRMRRFTPRRACTCCSDPMSYVRQRSSTTMTSPVCADDTCCVSASLIMLFRAIQVSFRYSLRNPDLASQGGRRAYPPLICFDPRALGITRSRRERLHLRLALQQSTVFQDTQGLVGSNYDLLALLQTPEHLDVGRSRNACADRNKLRALTAVRVFFHDEHALNRRRFAVV